MLISVRTSRLICAFLASICLTAGWPKVAEAGNWRVSPIKVNFDARTRSDVVTISNDGDQTLALEVSAVSWTQDGKSQDIYQPATDLVFFPKQLKIEPKQERIIRIGIKAPAINHEKSYRLFIKEIPNRNQNIPNTVAIAIQFGVPVFIKPVHEQIAGAITDTQILAGSLTTRIENQGNSHFRVSTISLHGASATGERIYKEEISGWYLLNGSGRTVTTIIPPEICRQLDLLDIQINADRINLNGRIDVDPTMCTAP